MNETILILIKYLAPMIIIGGAVLFLLVLFVAHMEKYEWYRKGGLFRNLERKGDDNNLSFWDTPVGWAIMVFGFLIILGICNS